ncbi:MAG: SUMF1/EgtB/PvdO family nonheme iron enzyme [Phycisphaerales bacterium]|jgi:formylglycine-generating enzyme required for sulfatase activity/outer membrane protein assembly factor BamB|nr:SUMF1/EgtB/PvdO family nonheme iron enzyme [Phycisphaerales bacterium]
MKQHGGMMAYFAAVALLLSLLGSIGSAGELEHIDIKLSDTESIKLVKVPAGKFTMGSPTSEKRRTHDKRESPQREVTISKAFHMGVCEVTRSQFAAFVKDANYKTQAEHEGWGFAWNGRVWDKVAGASWKKVGFEQASDHPVLCVSYDDTIAFCRWLSKKTSRPVRLPTEAQWEYACRAGTKTAYVWGDKWDDGKGWANASDASAKKRFRGWRSFFWDDGYVFTSPVGKYKANAFGLYDMHGNAWEWCADWYARDYYKTAPNVDPLGPETGSTRVIRGGGWMSSPPRCRAAGRTGIGLRGSYCDLIPGFRIVIEADEARKLPAPSPANREGWCDWRGPRRDAISPHLPEKLDAKPRFAWTVKTTGPGLSGIAAVGGRVILADKSADKEHDIWRCLDAKTGKEIWQLKYLAKGSMPYTNSPRATPVVYEGMVYLLGAFGDLHCVSLDTGKVLWKKHLIKDFDAECPKWGMTATPLIVDNKLIVNPGGATASLVALDRISGKVIWKTPGRPAAYAPFICANMRGRRHIIGYDATSLGGWDIDSGKRIWTVTPPEKADFNVPTPIAIMDRLLVATENNSTRLYDFTYPSRKIRDRPRAKFADLAPDMISPVAIDGMIFASHDSHLYCLDAKNLKMLWKARDEAYYGFATFIAGNGRVLIMTIEGELLLVRADRKKYELISRMQVFSGEGTEVWSHPAITNGCLYIRNKASISCLLLK